MPRPVDALPCGSRSTISTCSPIAASAVPRLIAVVVLPTPPFWLAIASTRAGRDGARAAARPPGAFITDDSVVLVMAVGLTFNRRVRLAASLRRRASFQRLDHDDAAFGICAAGREINLN